MRHLNLLNHPSRAQERRVFHRWWSSLAGVLVGSLLAWGGQQWQMAQTLHLQKAQSQLQSAWLERTQQTREATRHQAQQRWQAEQVGQLQQIARHQQAWMVLHERLQEAAQEQGLRLARLHSDAGQVELQGEMSRFEAMAAAQQSLSGHLGQAVALKNVTVGPASQVSFVWQTHGTALRGAPSDATAVTSPAKP